METPLYRMNVMLLDVLWSG